MHYRDARNAFTPTPHLRLVHSVDDDVKKLQELTQRLNEKTADVEMKAKLLESTLTEDQRAVFRDYISGVFEKDWIAMQLQTQMRLVNRRRNGG